MKAAIIGAGIGGLASALRLKSLGFEVDVFESSSAPGGKISQFTRDGFRFDMGPSLFTLPTLVTELFELFGEDSSDYFSYTALPVTTKYYFEDGTKINAYADRVNFAREIERKTKDHAASVLEYLEDAEIIYDVTAENFLFKPFEVSNFFSKSFLKTLFNLHKLNFGKTLHGVHESYFRDKKTIQLFDRYATYNGSDPYQIPGTFAVIPHLEHNLGVYFPEGGMFQIIESLYRLAIDQGVEFSFSEEVTRVNIEASAVNGLITSQGTYDYDLVVSDVDIYTLYKKLLPDIEIPKKQVPQHLSSSALIFYWGVDGKHLDLNLHNILFAEDYKNEFGRLFGDNTISDDPTVYIFISQKAVESDAPEGKENWFVMVNAPVNVGQNWDELIKKTRKNVIGKIKRLLDIDIRDKILFEEKLDPRRIEKQTGSWKGALYGDSSNNWISAFLRHKNKHPKLKNLYFSGGSVHPGGGIPLCLASAQIVEAKIKKDWNL